MRALGAPGRALALPVDPRDCAHIQNTEATADQFLVEDGEPGFMIDWEKPIVGEVAQDVAYFLAPTSTIWQDGPILTPAECERFVSDYWDAVDGRFPRGGFDARFAAFSMTNNLRGVTWSCQAWVDYHDPRPPAQARRHVPPPRTLPQRGVPGPSGQARVLAVTRSRRGASRSERKAALHDRKRIVFKRQTGSAAPRNKKYEPRLQKNWILRRSERKSNGPRSLGFANPS